MTQQNTATKLFDKIEAKFTRHGIIQFRMNEVAGGFSDTERKALQKLFDFYQPGMGTDQFMPAAIHLSEKQDAIDFLESVIGNDLI